MDSQAAVFWSGETLRERLGELIKPFSPDRIDCAAYTLAVGPEVYVSPSDQAVDPAAVTIRKLDDGEAFTIPPGQFAFLLTEEIVAVPSDGLAFISMRAKTKFRGLINVSGFHVDPGYRGQLTFAVFNAGPVPIHLKRGQPIFLIWYANVDRETTFKKSGGAHLGIAPDLISGVAGEVQSLSSLLAKINHVNKVLGERIHRLERKQAALSATANVIIAIIVGVVIALAVGWLRNNLRKPQVASPQSASAARTPNR